ncbi:hypothetical protein QBZ16_000365 [Prototheca wickerhamii]|uniref:Ubiquitin-like domain-containing protein n=1 Tax=Prototheca wickerhamii TaxID=3111 RepID=A0AAD9IPD2_PROWI|nr:hypothetical protein QBZ16_000365 [Prototheca wickerhamii]
MGCTLVEGHETLRGQTLSVAVPNLGITVLALKERLVEQVKVPANKQRISADGLGFLRDELSLAHYNVPREEALTLSIKERGGRRK